MNFNLNIFTLLTKKQLQSQNVTNFKIHIFNRNKTAVRKKYRSQHLRLINLKYENEFFIEHKLQIKIYKFNLKMYYAYKANLMC